MELKPGLAVNQNIRLVRKLGQGAMGAVWVADHLTLEMEVAVKFISAKHAASNPDLAKRFMLEAKAAAQMKSPHVVQIFDYGFMQSSRPYIVMELLEGESLAARLDRTGWLSFAQTARVVRHVARALTRAHAHNVVHRDIKPDNIFLCASEDGVFTKLLDFGVAKHNVMNNDGMTSPGVMVGTAEYMSREQVMSSKDVTHFTDLWALAAVTYEMLTGDVPFTGETLGMICVAICDGSYTPPSQVRKGVSPEIDAWFEKAFAKNKPDRFQSAKELSDAFAVAICASGGVIIDDEPSVDVAPALTAPRTRVGLGSHPRAVGSLAVTSSTLAPHIVAPKRGRRLQWALLAIMAVAVAAITLTVGIDDPHVGQAARSSPTGRAPAPSAPPKAAATDDTLEEDAQASDPTAEELTSARPAAAHPTAALVVEPSATAKPRAPKPPASAPTPKGRSGEQARPDYGF